jgi:hypothetical protein
MIIFNKFLKFTSLGGDAVMGTEIEGTNFVEKTSKTLTE